MGSEHIDKFNTGSLTIDVGDIEFPEIPGSGAAATAVEQQKNNALLR